MTHHTAPGYYSLECLKAEHGACRLCDALDRTHASYSEEMRKLFHPDEFPGEFEPPSLAAKATNFAGAMGRVVSAAVHGRAILIDAATHEARLTICRGTATEPKCEFFQSNPIKCGKCSCPGLKWWLATERCPIGKWEAVQVTSNS